MPVSGEEIVQAAAKEMGDPYVWGAEGPNSFDCSGLVEYVFKKFGIKTPRIAADQAHYGQAIAKKDIRPGDLIFFNWNNGSRASHVGIYAGGGYMIHAPHSGTVVKKVKLSSYYWANSVGIRRFPGVKGGPADSETIIDKITGGAAGAATGLTGALGNIAGGLADIARAALSVGKVADSVARFFLPSNMLRAGAWVAGSVFILLGIFFLSREVRN